MRPEDTKTLSYAVAFGRMAVGTVALLAPGFAMHVWLDAEPRSEQVKAMGLALGARDMVLGLGTLQALRGRGNPAIWLQLGALADAADGVGTFRAFRKTPRNPRMLIGLVAVGFAGVCWLLGLEQKEQESNG